MVQAGWVSELRVLAELEAAASGGWMTLSWRTSRAARVFLVEVAGTVAAGHLRPEKVPRQTSGPTRGLLEAL